MYTNYVLYATTWYCNNKSQPSGMIKRFRAKYCMVVLATTLVDISLLCQRMKTKVDPGGGRALRRLTSPRNFSLHRIFTLLFISHNFKMRPCLMRPKFIGNCVAVLIFDDVELWRVWKATIRSLEGLLNKDGEGFWPEKAV